MVAYSVSFILLILRFSIKFHNLTWDLYQIDSYSKAYPTFYPSLKVKPRHLQAKDQSGKFQPHYKALYIQYVRRHPASDRRSCQEHTYLHTYLPLPSSVSSLENSQT